jgi:predicted transposase/invertase (TIGR01784 family)
MLTSSIQREKEEIFEKGRQEGKLEGKIEGKIEGKHEDKIETAQKMIAMGFEIALISELTGLPQEEILPLMQETERR